MRRHARGKRDFSYNRFIPRLLSGTFRDVLGKISRPRATRLWIIGRNAGHLLRTTVYRLPAGGVSRGDDLPPPLPPSLVSGAGGEGEVSSVPKMESGNPVAR